MVEDWIAGARILQHQYDQFKSRFSVEMEGESQYEN
jgi:hypothetical protein